MLINANCDNGVYNADSHLVKARVNQIRLLEPAYHESPEIILMKNFFLKTQGNS